MAARRPVKPTASDLAYTARLKWTGMPGVEIGGTVHHQTDITQGSDATAGSANLYELHTVLSKGPLGLRALYAMWDLDGSGPAASRCRRTVRLVYRTIVQAR